ncbi:ATP-grasp domain-containing protein [Lapidilactobacillus luobeiensis]|uniref:ATP-grasp domain-containing protein n=1 Tax=Lapidilactobacillus luobeiensis TaxID=2950371 RepID=UPI0021C4B1ED|nr:ATP-grasp domain-containing protein [Lapidilactobacillus luobeiensis]
MKHILIFHPYREQYTDIYQCLAPQHAYTIIIDHAKAASFQVNQPVNVTLVFVKNYQLVRERQARELLTSTHFDAIIALDEFDIELAGKLRTEFNLPGQSLAEARIFRDKATMVQQVSAAGFKVPHSQVVSSSAALAAFFDHNHDIIVKPLNGAGSINTFHLKEKADLTRFQADHDWIQQTFLAQQYLYADIYHIDGLIAHGQVLYCEPARYIYNPLLIKAGVSAAAVSLDHTDASYLKLNQYATNLVKKLAPTGTFLFHLEVFFDNQEIIFLEIGSRIGGARIRQNLEFKLNCNPLKLLIYSVCAEQLPVIRHNYPVTGWLLTAKQAGTIQALPEFTEAVKSEFSIFDEVAYVRVGSQIGNAVHSADAVIGLSVYGASFRSVKTQLLRAERWAQANTRYQDQ